MAEEVIMPSLGEGVIEGVISRWLKQEGDQVDQYEPILEIETDKVTTEATAEVAGTLLKILVSEGETVSVGTVLAYIGEAGEAVPDETVESQAGEAAPEQADHGKQQADHRVNGGAQRKEREAAREEASTESISRGPFPARISPVVARMAAEHNLDLEDIEGTGRGGRITKKDVLAYLEAQEAAPEPPPAPAQRREAAPTPAAAPVARPARPERQAAQAIPGELMPLSNMRRAIAEHMVRSKQTSPHVTTVFEVDFSLVMAHRKANKAAFARDGARLTFTPYLISAIVQALKQHPLVNSSWSDEGIIIRREVNIGMAAAVSEGLIVPVIKGADSLNLLGLTRVINDLTERARTGTLRPEDVQGGTFTLTNHGTSGSLFATPIINQPQCGILGVGQIQKRVVVIDDMIAIRPLAHVSFTFDHRILDGASADAFVSTFKEIIESWQ